MAEEQAEQQEPEIRFTNPVEPSPLAKRVKELERNLDAAVSLIEMTNSTGRHAGRLSNLKRRTHQAAVKRN
jgi:hypothetical protein